MDLRDQLKNLSLTTKSRILKCQKKCSNRKNLWSANSKRKGRNGKPVTLIEGWEGDDEGLKEISKKSKQHLELVARKKTASSSSRATTVTK
jgi:translation initiation factor 1